MRTLLLVLAFAGLAGCAGAPAVDPTPPAATPPGTAAATPPATSTVAAPPTPTPEASPQLGVVFEETYSFEGKTEETRRNFEVPRGAATIRFYVESAGPPADGSFASAVMDVYTPRSTSAMFAELPAEEARSYTLEQTGGDPYWGTWMVRFAGQGKTSVTLRVTAE